MKTVLLTKEYPPSVYGGAGVHVEYLSRALARHIEVEVLAFGAQDQSEGSLRARGLRAPEAYQTQPRPDFQPVIDALATNLHQVLGARGAHVVHSHTWYTQMAGLWAQRLYGIPHVVTVHSLEPLRPWKVEQLGRGYELTSWIERSAIESCDAVIAVSAGTRRDVLSCYPIDPARVHVIHNGIDIREYVRKAHPDVLRRYGVDPGRPFALFVGRITAQKGLQHFLDAADRLDREAQVVLLAGAPDTQEFGDRIAAKVAALSARRPGVVWVDRMLPRDEVIAFYSHATVYCCPSVYEPFGLVNVEAMACEAPVVATATGGMLEIVVDGETGFLVKHDPAPGPTQEPRDPAGFARGLADAMNRLIRSPELARRLGGAGRERVVRHFSWDSIAEETVALYRSLVRTS